MPFNSDQLGRPELALGHLARRWGHRDDFGGIAVYLASEASAYHTGEAFVIDGGYTKF